MSQSPKAKKPRRRFAAVASKKGGVGKSTTAINVFHAAMRVWRKYVRKPANAFIADYDDQQDTTLHCMNGQAAELRQAFGAYDALVGKRPADLCTVQLKQGQIIPATFELPAFDTIYSNDRDAYLQHATKMFRETGFDFGIIDTPGELKSHTIMALASADAVIIPIKIKNWELKQAKNIINLIASINDSVAIAPEIFLLPSMAGTRKGISKAQKATVAEIVSQGVKVLPAIPRLAILEDAAQNGLTLPQDEPTREIYDEIADIVFWGKT